MLTVEEWSPETLPKLNEVGKNKKERRQLTGMTETTNISWQWSKMGRKTTPANMEKTRHAGMGTKVPTAKAKISDKLASVMDGPTSTSALLMRSSKVNSNGCRFTACTNIHMLSTPTWLRRQRENMSDNNFHQRTNILKLNKMVITTFVPFYVTKDWYQENQ